MAKKNQAMEATTGHNFFPEDIKFEKVSEDNISFWNFEKHEILYCKFKSIEELTHPVYLVTDLTSDKDYYLKSHDMIKDHIEGNKKKGYEPAKEGDIFKIHFLDKSESKDKSFYIYDIFKKA